MIATAEAESQKLQREGAGRASAIEAEGRAEAEKIRALGLAEAAKIEAQGLAHAKAVEAQGLAEATAIKEKAAAWREFNDAARLQTILEKLPEHHRSDGAGAESHLRTAGKYREGGDDRSWRRDANGGGSGLNRFAQTGPTMIYALLQQLQALGLNVPEIMKQLSTAEKTSEAIGVDNGDSANETKNGPKSPA